MTSYLRPHSGVVTFCTTCALKTRGWALENGANSCQPFDHLQYVFVCTLWPVTFTFDLSTPKRTILLLGKWHKLNCSIQKKITNEFLPGSCFCRVPSDMVGSVYLSVYNLTEKLQWNLLDNYMLSVLKLFVQTTGIG